jgi:hypothetical protein
MLWLVTICSPVCILTQFPEWLAFVFQRLGIVTGFLLACIFVEMLPEADARILSTFICHSICYIRPSNFGCELVDIRFIAIFMKVCVHKLHQPNFYENYTQKHISYSIFMNILSRKVTLTLKKKTKLHGLSPRANYSDRATAACQRSDCQLLRIESATWSAWRIPTAVFSVF